MEGGIMSEAYVVTTEPTKVKVDLSFTRNLGNYESIKISIGVEDTVRQGENVDSATDRVYEFVENKLLSKTREVEEELARGKK
jgi:hypothetical protein